jgi:hypothetical protein
VLPGTPAQGVTGEPGQARNADLPDMQTDCDDHLLSLDAEELDHLQWLAAAALVGVSDGTGSDAPLVLEGFLQINRNGIEALEAFFSC